MTKRAFHRTRPTRLLALLGVIALAGCSDLIAALPPAATPPPAPKADPFVEIVPVSFVQLRGWKKDMPSQALPAFLKSCDKLEGKSPDVAVGTLEEMGKVKDWLPICQSARIIRPGNDVEARYFFESRFQPYVVRDRLRDKGLITGYYEAELRGSFSPDARYRYPIYSTPRDLVSADLGQFDDQWTGVQIAGRLQGDKFIPYLTRAQIESGGLKGRQLEILWVDDAVDAFVLHIQGSGRVILPDGSHIRLQYAGRNGHRYTAIGRELVARRVMRLEDVTMPAIRAWLLEHPVAASEVMQKNRSFIFFRVGDTHGPIGAQGVVLTPGRSLAVDRRFLPLGVPLWVSTTDPGTKPAEPLDRLVVSQDTGSAIRGPVRADLFWGYGAEAGWKAGLMKSEGRLYVLLPKSLVPVRE